MKYLVRDGSKKLRDAKGLPDEALMAVNRQRGNSSNDPYQTPMMSPSSRKRVSPYPGSGGPHFPPSSPKNPRPSHGTTLANSAPSKMTAGQHHPSDYSNARRMGEGEDRQGPRKYLMADRCQNDGDWSSAMNLSRGFNSIWNCGASGTVSPTQMAHEPKQFHQHPMSPSRGHHQYHHHQHHNQHHNQPAPPVVNGRNEQPSYRMANQMGRMGSERIEAPGYEVRA